jgi:hypothetical protein
MQEPGVEDEAVCPLVGEAEPHLIDGAPSVLEVENCQLASFGL